MGDQKSDKGLIPNTNTSVEQDSYTRIISMSGLLLPDPMKLKGPENYPQWKQVMIRNIIASGLINYLKSNQNDPKMDTSDWKSLSEKYLDNISDWVQGNTRAANMIMFNCTLGPQSIISNYHSAAEMWEALEQAYE
ncbi:hypothetical protein K3495_g14481, partial [Podosphaera aphanis]